MSATRNPWEDAARERKAAAIAAVLDGMGVTPDQAEVIEPGLRVRIAQQAGVKPPSEQTWELVVKVLGGIAAIRAALPSDPFDGIAS